MKSSPKSMMKSILKSILKSKNSDHEYDFASISIRNRSRYRHDFVDIEMSNSIEKMVRFYYV